MNIKNKISVYFSLAEEIHEYFGYKEDWVCIPVVETGSPDPLGSWVLHSGKIYYQRFLNKWVSRGEELTLVAADTQTDGNKFLMIFENNKECKDKEIKQTYMNKWGQL